MAEFFSKKNTKIIAFIIMIATCIPVAIHWQDSDMNWLIATGRYIVNNGIPYKNPFIFLDGFDIVVQQWGYAAIVALIYDNIGSIGMILFLGVLEFINAWLIYKLVNRHTDNSVIAVLAAVFGICVYTYNNLRPELITSVLIFAELNCLDLFLKTGRRKWLIGLPATMILEANLHIAMWPLHFVVLLPYCVPVNIKHIINKSFGKKQILPVFVASIASLITTFINPYGIDGVTYVFKSYNTGLSKLNIAELCPLSADSIYFVYWMIILVMMCYLAYRKKLTSAALFMTVGFMFVSISHLRNYAFLIISVAYLFTCLDEKCFDIFKRFVPNVNIIILALCYICFLVQFGTAIATRVSSSNYDNIISYLDEHADKETAKIFTSFSSGATLEFNGYKIFTDARPELYHESLNNKASIMWELEYANLDKDYDSTQYIDTVIEPFLDKYDFDYIVVLTNNKTLLSFSVYLDLTDEYTRVATDKNVVLYEKVR